MKPKLHELTDRWAAMLLVLVLIFLLFAGPLSQKADAVVVSSVIVGAVIATMALAGITFVASGMTAAQLQDWVSEKLDEWAADLGSPLDHLINSAGIGVTISGLLTIGTAAAQGINQFITWLKTQLGLNDNETVSVQQATESIGPWVGQTLMQMTGYIYQRPGGNRPLTIVFSENVFAVCPNVITDTYYFISRNSFQLSINGGNSITAYYDPENDYYEYVWGYGMYNVVSPNPQLYENHSTNQAFLDYLKSNVNEQISSSGALSIGAGVITLPQVQNDDKVFVDVGALPGSTVTEVTEGVISDAVTNTLDVSGEVAESEPEYVIDGPEPVYGLADVFPFCIPFDLYDFVSCLAADPVAPHFEWRLYVEDLVDYTFVIDLQQFETVAQIFRTMFLLAFIIGLAMVTRHLLRS